MMLTTKQKVDRLERIFSQYMTQTNAMMERIQEMQADMKHQANLDRQRSEENFERARLREEENRKLDRKERNKLWGELANRLGTIVEDIVAPNLPRIAKEYFNCDEIDDFMVRRLVRSKKDRSKRREFDVIVVAGDTVILNETKATPTREYIDQFLNALPEFTEYFPEYRGKTLIPVFASLAIREELVVYLTKHNIYAMTMGNETMELVNFQELGTKHS